MTLDKPENSPEKKKKSEKIPLSAYFRPVVVVRAVSFSKYEFSEYLRFPSLIHLIKLKEKLNGQKRKIKNSTGLCDNNKKFSDSFMIISFLTHLFHLVP